MRRLLSIGLGALAMIASIATAVPARAGTIDVLPGESIQAAVTAAQPGDTIQLHPGVYEDVVVIKKDDITIQGAGSGEDGTILHPPATLPGRCFGGIGGICVLGDVRAGVAVNGVTVTGIRAEGFVFGMVAVAAHLTSFEGNAAVDNEEYGIAAFDSNSTTMADNVVSGSGEAGLYVGDSGPREPDHDGQRDVRQSLRHLPARLPERRRHRQPDPRQLRGDLEHRLPRLGQRRPLPHRRERDPRQQRLVSRARSPAIRRCRVSASSS